MGQQRGHGEQHVVLQVGVGRGVTDHAGHLEILDHGGAGVVIDLDAQAAAQRRQGAEIFPGRALADDDCFRLRQGRAGVALPGKGCARS